MVSEQKMISSWNSIGIGNKKVYELLPWICHKVRLRVWMLLQAIDFICDLWFLNKKWSAREALSESVIKKNYEFLTWICHKVRLSVWMLLQAIDFICYLWFLNKNWSAREALSESAIFFFTNTSHISFTMAAYLPMRVGPAHPHQIGSSKLLSCRDFNSTQDRLNDFFLSGCLEVAKFRASMKSLKIG